MTYLLIVSLLAIPVLLLSSPILVLVSKQRSELALYYFISLSLCQLMVIVSYWQAMVSAATWVVILVGLSQLIGCVATWYKSANTKWLQYAVMSIILTFSLLLLSGAINL